MPSPTSTQQSIASAIWRSVVDNSLLLVVGAVAALAWANLDLEHYSAFTHAVHFAVNDIAMVFFFGLATKEVYEATLPGGPLASPREGAVPVFAAVGGMTAPASLYLLAVWYLGRPDLQSGWAIPCATDIAFSYLVARFVFPPGHPAIPFLLLLAIADDALGLIVLAIFYPSGAVSVTLLAAFLLPAVVLAWVLRRYAVRSFWWYLLGPGALSWTGLYLGGLHPALALVPIVPFIPSPKAPITTFGSLEPVRLDTLHDFETWWRIPVQFVLLAFGLVNAGVPLTSVGAVTWIVAGSLIIGKPIGIVVTTMLAELVGLRRAGGLDYRSLVTLGVMAGIGFTVALFFTTASFRPGPTLDQAKMGALLSFFAAFVAIAVGRVLGIKAKPA